METGFDKLSEPEFEIRNIKFRINKLKGIAGFELLEKVRTALGQRDLSDSFSGDEMSTGASIIGALCSIPSKNVMDILNDCKSCIDVKLPSSQGYMPFREVEGLVAEAIEPIDYYELIARALSVNFTKSFLDLLSRFGLSVQEG